MDVLLAVATALAELGMGITSNAAYDYLKAQFKGRTEISTSELQSAIGNYLTVKNVNANAATAMELLAKRGIIQVIGSNLYAPLSLMMGAEKGATFSVGDGTTTRTDRTAIEMGVGAKIQGSNAEVRQNPDGSISFLVGK